MTELDRISAAINDESPITVDDQRALVEQALARRLPRDCRNCLTPLDEANFCAGCGRTFRPADLAVNEKEET